MTMIISPQILEYGEAEPPIACDSSKVGYACAKCSPIP